MKNSNNTEQVLQTRGYLEGKKTGGMSNISHILLIIVLFEESIWFDIFLYLFHIFNVITLSMIILIHLHVNLSPAVAVIALLIKPS